jgi:light-harvesting complex I chlorophyll a/b binding protein 5
VQAELVHGRWAMLGVAGILFTSIGAAAGLGFPQWFDAGKVAAESSYASFPNLLVTTFLLMGWAEGKRWADIKNPGSQGDGSFFGVTDDFKGKENGYPGGRFFDPMGLSRGSDAQYKKYKENEIKNGRLAMVAMLGFFAQYSATGEGPLQNLQAHLADPYHTTFATNGVSLPWLK